MVSIRSGLDNALRACRTPDHVNNRPAKLPAGRFERLSVVGTQPFSRWEPSPGGDFVFRKADLVDGIMPEVVGVHGSLQVEQWTSMGVAHGVRVEVVQAWYRLRGLSLSDVE